MCEHGQGHGRRDNLQGEKREKIKQDQRRKRKGWVMK